MLLLCYALVHIMEMSAGVWFLYNLYPIKRPLPCVIRGIIIMACVFLGFLYVLNVWDFFISNSLIIVHSALVAFIYCCYFRAEFLKVFAMELLYMVSISFLKLPLLIIKGILRHETLLEVNRSTRTVADLLWSACLVFMIIVLMYKGKKGRESICFILSEYKTQILVIGGIQWGLLSYNMWLGKHGFSHGDLILNLSLDFSMFIFLLYLILRFGYREMQLDNKQLNISQELLQKQNRELQEMYRRNRVQIHNIYHNMLYLYHCLEDREDEEAKKFLVRYLGECRQAYRHVWTGMPFLDFILNHKKQVMDQKNISFQLELDMYEYPFEEEELGLLLGNLLDNAIEASEKCEVDKREIYLKIWNAKQMFLMKLRNSSSKEPTVKEGKFMTDKVPPDSHGMGVALIRRIVKKYGGDIDFQFDAQQFEVYIMVSL